MLAMLSNLKSALLVAVLLRRMLILTINQLPQTPGRKIESSGSHRINSFYRINSNTHHKTDIPPGNSRFIDATFYTLARPGVCLKSIDDYKRVAVHSLLLFGGVENYGDRGVG